MSVVPYEPRFVADWLRDPAEIAQHIGGTDFVPVGLRNNPAAITAALLYGDEVGLGPMQSLAKIAVINGRPTLAAEAQRALILQAGHDLWIEEATVTRCTVCGRRRGSDQVSRVTWTLDDAKRAGIGGKQPWRAYPRQMLLARASAELARAVFADAIGGMAATEELAEGDEAEPNGVAETKPAGTTRRRQRASIAAASHPASFADPAPKEVQPEEPPLPGDDGPQPFADDAGASNAAAHGGGDVGPPDDAPVAASDEAESISDEQLKLLMLLLREHGFTGREHRLAWATVHVGRHITTSKDLTRSEASHLIDLLQAMTPSTGDEP